MPPRPGAAPHSPGARLRALSKVRAIEAGNTAALAALLEPGTDHLAATEVAERCAEKVRDLAARLGCSPSQVLDELARLEIARATGV